MFSARLELALSKETDFKSAVSTIPPREQTNKNTNFLEKTGFEPMVFTYACFQNKCLKPLSHFSVFIGYIGARTQNHRIKSPLLYQLELYTLNLYTTILV